MNYLVLKIGETPVAIEGDKVFEVVPAKNLRPANIGNLAGFVPWRGKQVPVVDPASLGFADARVELVAIVQAHGSHMGFPGSSAVGVISVEEDSMEKPPPGLPAWVKGVHKETWVAEPELVMRPADTARALAENLLEFLEFCAGVLAAQEDPALQKAKNLIQQYIKEKQREKEN